MILFFPPMVYLFNILFVVVCKKFYFNAHQFYKYNNRATKLCDSFLSEDLKEIKGLYFWSKGLLRLQTTQHSHWAIRAAISLDGTRRSAHVKFNVIYKYIVGSRGASQLGGSLLGIPLGYKAN